MACTATLNGFGNSCETSKGGVKAIWIAPYKEGIATLTTSSSGEVGKVSIAQEDIAKFKVFYIKQNTTSFTSTLTTDPANGVNYVSTVISIVFTKMNTRKRIEMSALAVNDVNIIVQDANNSYWFLGLDEAVTATNATGETGTAKTDGNKYTIEFTDDSDTYPIALNAASVTLMKSIAKQ